MKLTVSLLQLFIGSEQGSAAVEYALLAALIAAVIVAVIALFGVAVKDQYCAVLTALAIACP